LIQPITMKAIPSNTPSLKSRTSRRGFLKRGLLAGGSLLLLSGGRGRGAEPAPAGGAEASQEPANATLQTIHRLHSTHGNFLDKPVPDGTLRAILRASVRAAGASNNQSYSIIVVKDRPMMKDLCGYQGSCLLLYCADYSRMKASAAALGYDYQPGTIVDFVTAGINTILAAQTAVIAARSLGVDSLLTNGIHRGDMERHWKLLDLPPTHCFPLIALVLGYADRAEAYRAGRLDGLGVIHEGKYHPLNKDEVDELTRLYDDKERHIGLNTDWDTQGYQHYLDWYFKAWVGRNLKPGTKETQMLRLLKRSGFVESA
jgi:nitroreductase